MDSKLLESSQFYILNNSIDVLEATYFEIKNKSWGMDGYETTKKIRQYIAEKGWA